MPRKLQQTNGSSTAAWRATSTSQSPQNTKRNHGKEHPSKGMGLQKMVND